MADDSKRYFWLKLKEDFFQDDIIEWLEEQQNGKDYVLFYLKLCLKSLKNNGILIRQVGNMLVPYDVAKLAEITNTGVDTVAVALKVFKNIGLIEVQESGQIYLTQLQAMVGSETAAAVRKRMQRAGTNRGQIRDNVPQSIEYRDKNIEIEKEKEKEERKPARHKYGQYSNVLLTGEELDKLKTEFPEDWEKRIERLSEYIASSGKRYKSHLATIRSWARKDKPAQKQEPVDDLEEFIRRGGI